MLVWAGYRQTLPRYPLISLTEERRLIAKAQGGSKKETKELIFYHLGFIIFRIHKKAFPSYIARYGADILSQTVFILGKVVMADANRGTKHISKYYV